MSPANASRPDFRLGDWLVRPSLATIERGSDAVHVTPRSMAVLIYLADADGEVVSRNDVLDAVWPGMSVTPDALSQCVVELRKAFRDNPRQPAVIQTIPKIGLRLLIPVTRVETQPAQSISPPAAPVPAQHQPQSQLQPQPQPQFQPQSQLQRQPQLQPEPALPPPPAQRKARLLSARVALTAGLVVLTMGSAALLWNANAHRTWQDPLVGADFRRLTDFVGSEEHAAISADGGFIAFLSDRDGAWDVFISQTGTGNFRNLTRGKLPGLRNPDVRMLDFSPTGSEVMVWSRGIRSWSFPIVGGDTRPGPEHIAEVSWSRDGKRLAYHPATPGDPLFVASAGDNYRGKRIYVAPSGVHCHFPIWSRDGKTIYFVQGFVPDEMDIWQIPASGGEPQRLTRHNSRVSFPTLLDEQTLLYLATDADGSGPWIYALDLGSRSTHRVKSASNAYTSLAATADGRRLVVTESHPIASLWSVQLAKGVAGPNAVTAIPIHTQRGVSPRLGPGSLLYRAPKAGTDGLWKRQGSADARELWSGQQGRVINGPALSADGEWVAFTARSQGKTWLYVMRSNGTAIRKMAQQLDVRGAPAWSPDGKWIAIAALHGTEPRLFKIPATEGPAVELTDDYALDPVWSPSGQFLVYTSADIGTAFEVRAVSADGSPHEIPKLALNRGSRRLAFLGADEHTLVILKGELSRKEFWAIDLRSGMERPLTELGPGDVIGDFDVASDGRRIVFDRAREQSDIALIELAKAD